MKLDTMTVRIEPRSAGDCLDLAILFYREHLASILTLVLGFALPFALLANFLLEAGGTLWWVLAAFFVIAPLQGAVLVVAAGHRVFGEPFSLRTAWRRAAGRGFAVVFVSLVRSLIAAAAGLCLFVPALFVLAYGGFVHEALLLERVRPGRLLRRTRDLVSGWQLELFGRYALLSIYFVLISLVIFVLVDLVSGMLLGVPIIIGRREMRLEFIHFEVADLLFHDPRSVIVFCGVLWLLYPLFRLAWFFCYIDLRIRRESWDLELDFRLEAQRLEEVA